VRYLLAVVGLVLAGYLLTGVTQVRPGERAVVRRFGRIVAKPGPGLWVGLPWGMDRVDRVPIDLVRPVTVGYVPDADENAQTTPAGQLLTGDYNLVNVRLVVDYALRDEEVEDYILQAERVDGLVARAAEASLAEWVAGHTVDEVLLSGKVELPRWVVARTEERLRPYRLGIRLQAASIVHLFPPDEVKPAFDEVTRAETTIRTREQEALQWAERRRREAETEKFRIEQQTAAYANERLQLARTEAEAFAKRLEQYQRLRQQNPDILAAIWWDEMGRLFARLRENGRIDLLDNYLGPDGLDISVFLPQTRRK
jgi:membrane protease subunit HflK